MDDLTIAVVTWYDAFSDENLTTAARAKGKFPRGLPLVTVGVLIDDNEETILLCKDWMLPPYDLARNSTRIRKADIVSVHLVKMRARVEDTQAVPQFVLWDRDLPDAPVYGIVTIWPEQSTQTR